MANPNQHIRDELDYFRLAPGRAYYALQINAPWGAGKSHFISEYLDEATPSTPNEDGPLSLKISLFGAQSVADLESQVVAQLFTKSDRAIGTILSGVVTAAAKRFQVDQIAGDAAASARTLLTNNRLNRAREGLIVFDDLERSRMPLNEALGYINRFIEMEGFKVVLISNEDAFARNDASDDDKKNGVTLRKFKEKLVGRTLRLVADPKNAFSSFISNMRTERAKVAARDHEAAFLQLFEVSGRENLRSLRVGLEAFDRVVAILSPKVTGSDPALREIALCFLYAAIELAAAVDETIVANPSGGRLRRLIAGMDRGAVEERSPTERLAEDIVSRYSELVNLNTPAIPLDFVVRFIAHAHLDAAQINAIAEISPLVADPQDIPPWRPLVEIWDLDVETSQANVDRALDQLRGLKVLAPGELLHLAGIMLWREAYGDRMLSEGRPPVEFVQDYVNRLHASGRSLNFPFDTSGPMLAAYGIVAVAPDESKAQLKQIVDILRQSVDRSLATKMPDMRKRLMEFLRQPDRSLGDLYLKDCELRPYVRLAIFKDADPTELAELVLRNARLDYGVIEWLAERYNVSELIMREEAHWFLGFLDELGRKLGEVAAPFNQFWKEACDARLSGLRHQAEEIGRGREALPPGEAADGESNAEHP